MADGLKHPVGEPRRPELVMFLQFQQTIVIGRRQYGSGS
jgi:hypothetical protein